MLELNHKNRDFWKVGINFAIFIYEITEKFPKSELYGRTLWYNKSNQKSRCFDTF